MKKYSLLLASLLTLAAVVGCEKKPEPAPAPAPQTAPAPADAAPAEPMKEAPKQ